MATELVSEYRKQIKLKPPRISLVFKQSCKAVNVFSCAHSERT